MAYKPVVLIVLDGFGVAPPAEGNAISKAKMPVYRRFIESYPAMTVQASGAAVGLGWGEMGNSEVGHLTIGAGRIFYQSLPRINLAIETEDFYANPAFTGAIKHVQSTGGAVHLAGMVSAGGVHSSSEHLYALLELCKRSQVSKVFVHAFLDGRDTQFRSAAGFIQELEQEMAELGVGAIATLAGRYYAMDRDNRWDRVEAAYKAMALGEGATAEGATAAIEASYAHEVFDEQFVPTVLTHSGAPIATVNDGDALIFFNFRPDRMRELTQTFTVPTFTGFARQQKQNVYVATMTEYEKGLPVEVAFPPFIVDECLAKAVSDAGMRQLHIAETEKYAHVTFFLNGMREEVFPGEERVIVPSPRVSTYDQAPEMSVAEIADKMVKAIESGSFHFIVANFANADMVGHTGNEEATIKACEAIDRALGKVSDAVLSHGGAMVITADHGNAEQVRNLVTAEMDKEHSTNPVPCVIIASDLEGVRANGVDMSGGDLAYSTPVGMLADIAPTVCKLLGIDPPPDMTGQSLI